MRSFFVRASGWVFDVLGMTHPTSEKELQSYGIFWLALLGTVLVLVGLVIVLVVVVGGLGH